MKKVFVIFLVVLLFGCNENKLDLGDKKLSEINVPSVEKIKEIGDYRNGKKNGLWKYYKTESDFDSVVFYSKDYSKKMDENDFVLRKVKVGEVSVFIPKYWEIINDKRVIVGVRKKTINSDGFIENITIRNTVNSQLTDTLFVKSYINRMEKTYSKFKVLSLKRNQMDQNNVYRILYFLKTNNYTLGGVTYLYFKDNIVYELSGLTDESKNELKSFKSVFDEVFQTFKLVD